MPTDKISPPRRLCKPEGERVAGEVGQLVETSEDKEATAYTCARASFLALIYVSGPERAAHIAYQIADELADAASAEAARAQR